MLEKFARKLCKIERKNRGVIFLVSFMVGMASAAIGFLKWGFVLFSAYMVLLIIWGYGMHLESKEKKD